MKYNVIEKLIAENNGILKTADVVAAALTATCRKRGSETILPEYGRTLDEIHASRIMRGLWDSYQKKNSYASGVAWETVMNAIRSLCDSCIS